MTDDLEQEVRRRLHGASLPAAPAALREEIEHLRSLPAATTVRSSSRPPIVLLVAALATAALAVAALGLAGSTRPTPLPSTAPPTPPPRTYGFTRPGFAFDPPTGWTDQSTVFSFPVLPEQRFVGYLVHGMTSCPGGYGSLPPKPSGCDETATKPGSATLSILELNHQYPWLPDIGQRSTIAGYRATSQSGETESGWLIQSPDGGIFQLSLIAPKAELAEGATAVGKALESLQLTNWEESPTVVNGLIHEDPGQGFSFDYPAGWVRYYPTDISMMDAAVVTVASAPVLPPCVSDLCQRFTTPPGAIVIEFRVGNGPSSPDWSKATNRIGGQPASGPTRWGPQNATSAEEGYSWNVRLGDRPILGIDASLDGPDLSTLRTAMNQVIRSIKITGR